MLLGTKQPPVIVGNSFERLFLCRNLRQRSFQKLSGVDGQGYCWISDLINYFYRVVRKFFNFC